VDLGCASGNNPAHVHAVPVQKFEHLLAGLIMTDTPEGVTCTPRLRSFQPRSPRRLMSLPSNNVQDRNWASGEMRSMCPHKYSSSIRCRLLRLATIECMQMA